MLVVSCGREKVQGSGEQPEWTRRHRLPRHLCPAPILTAPAPSEELVAPPCPRQKVRPSPPICPGGGAGFVQGSQCWCDTPPIITNLHPILFNGPILLGFLILKAPFAPNPDL